MISCTSDYDEIFYWHAYLQGAVATNLPGLPLKTNVTPATANPAVLLVNNFGSDEYPQIGGTLGVKVAQWL